MQASPYTSTGLLPAQYRTVSMTYGAPLKENLPPSSSSSSKAFSNTAPLHSSKAKPSSTVVKTKFGGLQRIYAKAPSAAVVSSLSSRTAGSLPARQQQQQRKAHRPQPAWNPYQSTGTEYRLSEEQLTKRRLELISKHNILLNGEAETIDRSKPRKAPAVTAAAELPPPPSGASTASSPPPAPAAAALALLQELQECEARVQALEQQASHPPLAEAEAEVEAALHPLPQNPSTNRPSPAAAETSKTTDICPPTPPLPARPSSRNVSIARHTTPAAGNGLLAGVPAVAEALSKAGVVSPTTGNGKPRAASNAPALRRHLGRGPDKVGGNAAHVVTEADEGRVEKDKREGSRSVNSAGGFKSKMATQANDLDVEVPPVVDALSQIRELQLKVLRQEAMINALQSIVQTPPLPSPPSLDSVTVDEGISGTRPVASSAPMSSSSSTSSSCPPTDSNTTANNDLPPSSARGPFLPVPSLASSLSRVGLGVLGFEDLGEYISSGGVAIEHLLDKVTRKTGLEEEERIMRDLEQARRHKAWRNGQPQEQQQQNRHQQVLGGEDECEDGIAAQSSAPSSSVANRSMDRSQILSNEDMGICPPQPTPFTSSASANAPFLQAADDFLDRPRVTFASQVVVNSGMTPSKLIVGRGKSEGADAVEGGQRKSTGNIAVTFGAGKWSRPATF